MKRQTGAWLVGLCMVGAAAGVAAQGETHRCDLADGRVVFQQKPCALADLVPPAPAPAPAANSAPAVPAVAQPAPVRAAPERPTSVPATTAVAPAPPPAVQRAEEEFVRPTRRMREVLALSAQLERCRADVPGFAEKSAPVYAAWKRRHAEVLSEYDRQLAAKVRASRRGEAALPVGQCTDAWLQGIEPLTRMPDGRFATVEKTWQVFMGALMTGDRTTALSALSGRAGTRWKHAVDQMSDEDLRQIASSIRTLKVQWGDDYAKEGVIADTANRVVGIAFENVNEEWKITDWGGAAAPVAGGAEEKKTP